LLAAIPITPPGDGSGRPSSDARCPRWICASGSYLVPAASDYDGGVSTMAIALLRGINVGGKKIVPMADLRRLAEKLGFEQVATFIQSGNLVFSSEMKPAQAEAALETAIESRFGFPVEVIVRTETQWRKYAAGSPFVEAQSERPKLLLLGLSKQRPKAGAAEALRKAAAAGERVEIRGDAIWIDFHTSIGQSKLTPAVLDRAVGSTVTARNWNTLQKLAEMAQRP
jgi:uncharacterized protein (DUF1697 family)